MRIVIQRVDQASVNVDSNVVGKIGKGFVVLLGIKNTDTYKDADYLVRKLTNLRVFMDDKDKMNLSLLDVEGELLIISQFTLYGECKKSGNRPSFSEVAKPNIAIPLYEYFINECKKVIPIVQTGTFGAHMKVDLINDGPVTIIIDS
ncbi:MAG: D-aminoacyl-tRNA deacylase [Clostridia bacterium]|nr:D-aminoacyl-tRNA deacylase [Clostridia bacterium]